MFGESCVCVRGWGEIECVFVCFVRVCVCGLFASMEFEPSTPLLIPQERRLKRLGLMDEEGRTTYDSFFKARGQGAEGGERRGAPVSNFLNSTSPPPGRNPLPPPRDSSMVPIVVAPPQDGIA